MRDIFYKEGHFNFDEGKSDFPGLKPDDYNSPYFETLDDEKNRARAMDDVCKELGSFWVTVDTALPEAYASTVNFSLEMDDTTRLEHMNQVCLDSGLEYLIQDEDTTREHYMAKACDAISPFFKNLEDYSNLYVKCVETDMLSNSPAALKIRKNLGERKLVNVIIELKNVLLSHAQWYVVGNQLYVYEEPCWRELEDVDAAISVIQKLSNRLLDTSDVLCEADFQKVYRNLLIEDSIRYSEFPEPCEGLVNFEDAAIDFLTGEVIEHSPDLYFRSYIKGVYVEDVKNPNTAGDYFEAFAKKASGPIPEVRQQLLELLAIAVTGTQLKAFYALLGPSHTGKTEWGRFMAEVLGHSSTETLQSVSDLGGRFALGSCIGKRLVLCLDMPKSTISDSAVATLKMLCGDDPIKAERKYQQAQTIYHKPLLVVAGNHPMKINHADSEEAFLNRQVIIPFSVPTAPESQIPKYYKYLIKELPYILHETMGAYQQLYRNNWVLTCVTVPAEYQTRPGITQGNVLDIFLERCVQAQKGAKISTKALYKAFQRFASESGLPLMEWNAFYRILSRMLQQKYPEATPDKHAEGERGYRGIALFDPERR